MLLLLPLRIQQCVLQYVCQRLKSLAALEVGTHAYFSQGWVNVKCKRTLPVTCLLPQRCLLPCYMRKMASHQGQPSVLDFLGFTYTRQTSVLQKLSLMHAILVTAMVNRDCQFYGIQNHQGNTSGHANGFLDQIN